jgi:hypothetical protein
MKIKNELHIKEMIESQVMPILLDFFGCCAISSGNRPEPDFQVTPVRTRSMVFTMVMVSNGRRDDHKYHAAEVAILLEELFFLSPAHAGPP